jgi:hypothetical protein
MRTKSAYRERPENIPIEELPPALPDEPSIKRHTISGSDAAEDDDLPPAMETETPQPEIDPATQAAIDALNADAAAARLREQIQAQKNAEAFQAQAQRQQAVIPQRPMSHAEKLESWGLTEVEKKFLSDHPQMLDCDPALTAAIQTTVRSGVNRDDAEFLPKVKQNFDFHFERFQRQAAATAPAMFRPEPPRVPSRPSEASYTSAPVSREGPTTDRPAHIPTKITLSLEEREAARIAGVSELEYAHQKRRLLLEKAQGHRQT